MLIYSVISLYLLTVRTTLVSVDWCQTFWRAILRISYRNCGREQTAFFCNPHTSVLHPHPDCKHPSAGAAAAAAACWRRRSASPIVLSCRRSAQAASRSHVVIVSYLSDSVLGHVHLLVLSVCSSVRLSVRLHCVQRSNFVTSRVTTTRSSVVITNYFVNTDFHYFFSETFQYSTQRKKYSLVGYISSNEVVGKWNKCIPCLD